MKLSNLFVNTVKTLKSNSPEILTALGVSGVVITAYLVGKASFEASDIIREDESVRVPLRIEKPLKERTKRVWKLYIPAGTSAAMTVSAIILANRIGTRRAAAMAVAYNISEKAWGEYKDKVVEKIGVNKERSVRDEVAQDRVNANPVGVNQVIITGGGDVLCYDLYHW